MPIYNFKCLTSGKTYDKLVKMDTKEIVCGCGDKAIKNEVPVATNFVLKGDGWYKNDNQKIGVKK